MRGTFISPFAHLKTVPGFPSSALKNFAHKLERATVLCSDYRNTLSQAKAGDVVYCDPPYLELENGRGTFTSYGQHGFALAEHQNLASMARDLAARGIPVVLSNHDSPLTRNLYLGAELHTLSAYRSISAKSSARGRAPELVAVFNAR